MKVIIPPIKKPRRKVYLYQRGDFESMRKDALEFAKEKHFNRRSNTRSVQENFVYRILNKICNQVKHILSKTSRSVSSVPWITPEIRKKIHRRKQHAKAKKTDSSKLSSKFETLRREIKAIVRKQHDLYVNNLLVMLRQTSETSIGTSTVRKRYPRYSTPEKEEWNWCRSVRPWKGRGI